MLILYMLLYDYILCVLCLVVVICYCNLHFRTDQIKSKNSICNQKIKNINVVYISFLITIHFTTEAMTIFHIIQYLNYAVLYKRVY